MMHGVYILVACNGILGLEPTSDSAHSLELYTAAWLEDQASSTMTWSPTQSYYPDILLTSSCPILLMPRTKLRSHMYQFSKSLVWFGAVSISWRPAWEATQASAFTNLAGILIDNDAVELRSQKGAK